MKKEGVESSRKVYERDGGSPHRTLLRNTIPPMLDTPGLSLDGHEFALGDSMRALLRRAVRRSRALWKRRTHTSFDTYQEPQCSSSTGGERCGSVSGLDRGDAFVVLLYSFQGALSLVPFVAFLSSEQYHLAFRPNHLAISRRAIVLRDIRRHSRYQQSKLLHSRHHLFGCQVLQISTNLCTADLHTTTSPPLSSY